MLRDKGTLGVSSEIRASCPLRTFPQKLSTWVQKYGRHRIPQRSWNQLGERESPLPAGQAKVYNSPCHLSCQGCQGFTTATTCGATKYSLDSEGAKHPGVQRHRSSSHRRHERTPGLLDRRASQPCCPLERVKAATASGLGGRGTKGAPASQRAAYSTLA